MAITEQSARLHWSAPAVLCCRTIAGSLIRPEHLEDPLLFQELQAKGVLVVPDDALTVAEALGQTLIQTVEGLTALRPSLVTNPPVSTATCNREGTTSTSRSLRTLTQRLFAVKQVVFGDRTTFEAGTLTIRQSLCTEAQQVDPLVTAISIDVITAEQRWLPTNAILDVIPVATKVEGCIGAGVTQVLEGLVVVLTGADETGALLHEFGSSAGCLAETICFGRPGAPDDDDLILRVDVHIQAGTGMERRAPTRPTRPATPSCKNCATPSKGPPPRRRHG